MTRAWIALALACACFASHAAHFRWTSEADANTLDPHATSEPVTNSINAMSYDRLLHRDRNLALIPGLAVAWRNTAPAVWIFDLRRGVRFHDGTPFTARDVVFSFERAQLSESSVRVYAGKAGRARALDDHTVEFTTPGPNPVMPDTVSTIAIMSRDWCEKHGVTRPQNFSAKEETHAARNAMGTGPYMLVAREPGIRTAHRRNPGWWGIGEGLYEGNVDTIEYLPLASGATRLAALLSGQVDLVLDPSVQDTFRLREDPAVRLWTGPENRVVYIGFDQRREELLYSTVKGKNPFKDARVRRAILLAIDRHALRAQVMRGLSSPTLLPFHNPMALGFDPHEPLPSSYDPGAARRLLTEAGYPNGFGFRLSCTNNRFINDERLCVAIAAMLARVGLDVAVQPEPRQIFFAKAVKGDVSAYLMSYGGGDSAPIFMLKTTMRGPSPDGGGQLNYGASSNAQLDALIDRSEVEMDPGRRLALQREALELIQREVHVVPIHRQHSAWVSRPGVSVVHNPANSLVPLWVRVQ